MKDQNKFIKVNCTPNQLENIYDAFKKKEDCIKIKFAKDKINNEVFDLSIKMIPSDITKTARAIKNTKGVVINFIHTIQNEKFIDEVKKLLNVKPEEVKPDIGKEILKDDIVQEITNEPEIEIIEEIKVIPKPKPKKKPKGEVKAKIEKIEKITA